MKIKEIENKIKSKDELQFLLKGDGWRNKLFAYTGIGREVCKIENINDKCLFSMFNPDVVLDEEALIELLNKAREIKEDE